MAQWLQYDSTNKLLKRSTDNGGSFANLELDAAQISQGIFADARIPNLNASKITAGTFDTARIPNLAASKITSGTLDTARLGSGTANSSSFLRGDQSWQAVTVPITSYSATLADVVSTTTATPFCSITMPANEMADANVLEFVIVALTKQNVGAGTQPITFSVAWGSTTVTLNNPSWSDDGNERRWIIGFRMMRVGSDLWVQYSSSGSQGNSDRAAIPLAADLSGSTNIAVMTAPTFTSNQTVAVRAAPGANNANFYIKPQKAKVYRVS